MPFFLPALESRSLGGRKVVAKTFLPASDARKAFELIQASTTVASTTLASGTDNVVDFRIRPGGAALIEQAFIHYAVSESAGSNSVTTTPAVKFAERIEIIAPSGQVINTIRPRPLMTHIARSFTRGEFARYGSQAGFDSSFQPHARCKIPAGSKRDFMVPLCGSVLWQPHYGFPRHLLKGDLTVRCHFQASVSSGSGTLATDNIQLMLATVQPEDDGVIQRQFAADKGWAEEVRFVDAVDLFDSKTIAASTASDLAVAGAKGRHVCTEVFVSGSDSVTADAWLPNAYLGQKAQLDVLENGNKSLFDSGAPTASQLNILADDEMSFGLLTNRLILDHGDLSRFIRDGIVAGHWECQGQGDVIRVTPGAAATVAIHTVTPTAAPDAGSYEIFFKNPLLNSMRGGGLVTQTASIAYDGNAAAIKAALEAVLPVGSTVTASGAMTGAFTITWTAAPGLQGLFNDLLTAGSLQINMQANDGGAPQAAVVTLSTAPIEGCTGVGASKNLHCIAHLAKVCRISADGNIVVMDL